MTKIEVIEDGDELSIKAGDEDNTWGITINKANLDNHSLGHILWVLGDRLTDGLFSQDREQLSELLNKECGCSP